MRSTPFDEIERAFERMSRNFEETSPRRNDGETRSRTRGTGGASGTSLDVTDSDDGIVVTADLPGFERDDIDVSLIGHTLTIAAERRTDADAEAEAGERGTSLRRERRTESVRRAVRLPESIDADEASATYNNGVLTVTVATVTDDDGESGRRIEIE